MIVGDLLEITVRARMGVQEVSNVLHYLVDSGTPTIAGALAGFRTAWQVLLALGLNSDQYEVLQYEGRQAAAVVGLSAVDVRFRYDDIGLLIPVPTDPGTAGDDILPLDVAATARKITVAPSSTVGWPIDDIAPAFEPYKRFRGGLRWGALTQVWIDDTNPNGLDEGYRGNLETALQANLLSISATGGGVLQLVVVSLSSGLTIRTNVTGALRAAVQEVVGFSVNRYFGSQDTRSQRRFPI